MKVSLWALLSFLAGNAPASCFQSWSQDSAFTVRRAHPQSLFSSSLDDIEAATRQALEAADRAASAAASLNSKPRAASGSASTRHQSGNVGRKALAAAASATAISATLPLTAMAAMTSMATSTSNDAYNSITSMPPFESSLESSSLLLNYFEIASSLQIFYTAALVAGVGYTQRMAGREDFKKEMAMKIANGEITPEELVEEIRVMAEEINQSADVAVTAQMEVQKLLDETRAIASKFELPSSTTSSLTALNIGNSRMEEKEPIPLYPVEREEVKAEFIPMPSTSEVVAEPELSFEPSYQPIEIEEEIEIMQDDADLIADALLATPPHLVSPPTDDVVAEVDSSQVSKDAIEQLQNNFFVAQVGADAKNVSNDVEDNAMDAEIGSAVLEQTDAILSTLESASTSSSSLDQDISDALRLAEEAVALASNDETFTEKDGLQIVSEDELFIPPAPPELPPPLELVMESIEIEEQPKIEIQALKKQPAIKVTMNQKSQPKPSGPVRSSPLARILAAEHGLNIEDIAPGSGLKGRVVADDVREYVAMLERV